MPNQPTSEEFASELFMSNYAESSVSDYPNPTSELPIQDQLYLAIENFCRYIYDIPGKPGLVDENALHRLFGNPKIAFPKRTRDAVTPLDINRFLHCVECSFQRLGLSILLHEKKWPSTPYDLDIRWAFGMAAKELQMIYGDSACYFYEEILSENPYLAIVEKLRNDVLRSETKKWPLVARIPLARKSTESDEDFILRVSNSTKNIFPDIDGQTFLTYLEIQLPQKYLPLLGSFPKVLDTFPASELTEHLVSKLREYHDNEEIWRLASSRSHNSKRNRKGRRN